MARRRAPETLDLFAPETASSRPKPDAPLSAYVEKNSERLRRWASRGVYFGSSSWKYPGWKGQVYNLKYSSKKSFDRECLAEYAQLFPTVCADFALYDFPSPEQMHAMAEQTPDGFTVSLKVTDRITVRRYPNLPRHGAMAGKENPDFLNLDLFEQAFLEPVRQLGARRGVIIFEFSTFYPASGITYERFVALLDEFLGKLPKGYEYAVELRNREYLTQDYLAMLASHGVAHLLNNWTRMPPILEQVAVAGVLTAPFSIARALLRPGRSYQEAVDSFQPYDRIREENPELRQGLVEAVRRCLEKGKPLYAYVNNRAEGNSPKTIEAILDVLDTYPAKKL